MVPIARIHTSYGEKFGVPRQPGLAPSARGRIVFEKHCAQPEALRGLEGFSHLWLIFVFHLAEGWSPTVRPPRLGGNERVGVFASRSPFRPNPIGLSVVKIERVEPDAPEGPTVHVSGVDLVDGTPLLDIKPYVAYADALPEATGGFAPSAPETRLSVEIPEAVVARLAQAGPTVPALVREVLAADPRPAFHDDPTREYGVSLEGFNVRFCVSGKHCVVRDASSASPEPGKKPSPKKPA